MINENSRWVFLSHSNKDIINVREVRDKLEENGFYPIMFYLKCLEQEPDDTVLALLKREIQARPRFVLCRSANTIDSYWVKQEVEYIKSLNRPYETVELGNCRSICNGIERLKRRCHILLNSSKIENEITLALRNRNFFVSEINDNLPVYNAMGGMTPEQYWVMASSKIANSLRNGYCILLIYKNDNFSGVPNAIMNYINNDKDYMNYFIPIVMESNTMIPIEILRSHNLLDVRNIQHRNLPETIADHLEYIDALNNI